MYLRIEKWDAFLSAHFSASLFKDNMVKTKNKERTRELILLAEVFPSMKWVQCWLSFQGYWEHYVKQYRWIQVYKHRNEQTLWGKERTRFGIEKVTKDRMRTQVGRDQERVRGEGRADTGEREEPAEAMTLLGGGRSEIWSCGLLHSRGREDWCTQRRIKAREQPGDRWDIVPSHEEGGSVDISI